MPHPTYIVIPARMASKRLPGKPLAIIGGKPVVQLVWEQAKKSRLADVVLIATDHEGIYERCEDFGANVIMTSKERISGTDRVAEAMKGNDAMSIVVNLQGDLPFVDPGVCDLLISALEYDITSMVATPCNKRPAADRDWERPDVVKVVMDKDKRALYFSRSPIPSDIPRIGFWYHHFGIYAFRNAALQRFSSGHKSRLEEGEGLEQLRLMEAGIKIKMVETHRQAGFEINTPADLKYAQDWVAETVEG